MKVAALLIVLLSQDGYVLSDADAHIRISLAVARQNIPDAELVWDLSAGGVHLTGGKTGVDPVDGATLTLRAPRVRARTALTFSYRLVRKGRDEPLEAGRATLHVFPRDLLAGAADIFAGERMIVVDRDDAAALPAVLNEAAVPFTRVSDVAALQARKPRLVLVGPGILKRSPFEQAPLTALAESGCSVLVFQQSAVDHLTEYRIAPRAAAAGMEVATDHPLLRGLERADVASWYASLTSSLATEKALPAIQLPPDEPAREIISWPREAPGGEKPAPLDALLLAKSVGTGRIVLCQLPLGDFRSDPRSQVLLRNAIGYLLTRPEPTPPPSQRVSVPPPAPASQPSIQIPSGVRP